MKKIVFLVFYLGIFVTAIAQHHFSNVTSQYGIYGQSGLGHAVGWGDINNDGLQDVAFSNQEGDHFWIYKNNGDSFQDITSSAGLLGNSGEKILFVEVNGDEWVDLVLRPRSGSQRVYINNGDETFSIMSGSGVTEGIRVAADFDNDGWIDLVSTSNSSCSIFYNQAGQSFQKNDIGPCYDVMTAIAFDYNQDGWQDIYLGTYGDSPNILYKNNGDGSFENATEEAGLSYPYSAHGLTCGDYNNDGLIDVYVGSYSNATAGRLFKNNGDATFTDVAAAVGASGHQDTRNSSWVDYNNDGWLDLFSSHHDFYTYSNTLLKNTEGTSFEDLGHEMNISGEMIGDYFGVGWADFDNDGDMDLFAAGHIDKYVLWKNENCPGHFVEIILQGMESNHSAVGASATLWHHGQTLKRWVNAGQGRTDDHSLRLHFGLGEETTVDSLRVDWPSGNTLLFHSSQIPVDQIWTIPEDINMGMNQTAGTSIVQLLPNPTSGSFSVKNIQGRLAFSVTISDMQSRVILQKGPILSGEQISLPSSIQAGVYFVRVFNDELDATLKLIVQ